MNEIVGVNVFETPPPLGGAVPPAPTSVTGVLGVFERGLPHRPVRVSGPAQVAERFGEVTGDAVAALGLQLYFRNGGREAVVARVLGAGATAASLILNDRRAPAQPALRLTGGSRGESP